MELEFYEWLRGRLPQNDSVEVGPGDDAAVLNTSSDRQIVVTTDMLTDGVDFVLSQCDPRRVGRKALAVNLSDLAAMAARPTAAFVSLALPRSGALELAKELYEGLLPLAAEFGVSIAGGDTNCWEGPMAISITALGEVARGKAWRRSGAKPGDVLLVTGSLGGSILGKHFDFQPRVQEALAIARRYEVHAAIDISDGLSLDLWRLCQASGCGAELELAKIPISPAAMELSARAGVPAADHALSDGEDFELLLAMPADQAARAAADSSLGVTLVPIGHITSNPNFTAVNAAGEARPIVPRGYVH